MGIKIIPIQSDNIKGMAEAIEVLQKENKNLVPKGTVPFPTSYNGKLQALVFFETTDNTIETKPNLNEPTVAQVKALRNMGYSEVDISNMNKKEAWAIINAKKKDYNKPSEDNYL